ncbi:hypothetical protein BASA81_001726 [Batrachochytrium salamandrivorans]|nr:hypothetical protein BASA81_001726 [Batrachochytrium salamandrivorans]
MSQPKVEFQKQVPKFLQKLHTAANSSKKSDEDDFAPVIVEISKSATVKEATEKEEIAEKKPKARVLPGKPPQPIKKALLSFDEEEDD